MGDAEQDKPELRHDDRVRLAGRDDVGRVLDPHARMGDEHVVACRFPGDDTVSIHKADELELVERGSGDGTDIVRDMVAELNAALGHKTLHGAIILDSDGARVVRAPEPEAPPVRPYRVEWLEDVQKGWVLLLEGHAGGEEVVVIDRRDKGGAVSLKVIDKEGDQRGFTEHELYLVRVPVGPGSFGDPVDTGVNPT